MGLTLRSIQQSQRERVPCHKEKAPPLPAGLLVSAAPVLVWRGILRRMKTRAIRKSERSAPSRNIWIGSHRTSVRLEPTMWAALNDIAVERAKTVHDVVLEINRGRKSISLTGAIRVYIVEYYREALGRCRKEKAPPSPAGPS